MKTPNQSCINHEIIPFSFYVSEAIVIISLTIGSVLTSFCLLKVNRRSLQKNIQKRTENIPLQEQDSFHIPNILYGDDRSAIKRIISSMSSDNNRLITILCMINTRGSGSKNRQERRKINKLFLECLVDVKGSRPLALIWLKKHVSSETCSTMLSDEKYKGIFKS